MTLPSNTHNDRAVVCGISVWAQLRCRVRSSHFAKCVALKLEMSLAGWWGQPTPLKNDGVRQWVSDDIPYIYI